MWWTRHLFLIGMQIAAFVPYFIGSKRFYKREDNFMRWLAIGIILDLIMTFTPFLVKLPRMQENQGAPWSSILFIAHITCAGIGMFGFIIMFLYLAYRGPNRRYPRLRKFQYVVLFPLWAIGVMIALTNFATKVAFNMRIYDLL